MDKFTNGTLVKVKSTGECGRIKVVYYSWPLKYGIMIRNKYLGIDFETIYEQDELENATPADLIRQRLAS